MFSSTNGSGSFYYLKVFCFLINAPSGHPLLMCVSLSVSYRGNETNYLQGGAGFQTRSKLYTVVPATKNLSKWAENIGSRESIIFFK